MEKLNAKKIMKNKPLSSGFPEIYFYIILNSCIHTIIFPGNKNYK